MWWVHTLLPIWCLCLHVGRGIGHPVQSVKAGTAFREALAESRYRIIFFWGVSFCVFRLGWLCRLGWRILRPRLLSGRCTLPIPTLYFAVRLLLSIYCFAIWVVLFLFELLPVPWSFIVALFPFVMIVHIVVWYSAFGRLVMYTKAMRKDTIFHSEEEHSMNPHRLFEELLRLTTLYKIMETPEIGSMDSTLLLWWGLATISPVLPILSPTMDWCSLRRAMPRTRSTG